MSTELNPAVRGVTAQKKGGDEFAAKGVVLFEDVIVLNKEHKHSAYYNQDERSDQYNAGVEGDGANRPDEGLFIQYFALNADEQGFEVGIEVKHDVEPQTAKDE